MHYWEQGPKVRKSVYLWNIMLGKSNKDGLFTQTLNIYSSMFNSGCLVQNTASLSFTFPLVLKACTHLRDGTKLHSHIFLTGHHSDVFVQTSLLHMYSKCSDLPSSRQIFDQMPNRTLITYNSIISAYSRASLINQSISLFKQMQSLGFKPTSATFIGIVSTSTLPQSLSIHSCIIKLGLHSHLPLLNSLITMYIRLGLINYATSIFNDTNHKSIISWTTMLGGYVNVGNVSQVFNIFNQMRRGGVIPDAVVFVNLVSGCGGNLLLSSSVHCVVLKSAYDSENPVDNLLVTMYVKCGDIVSARSIFEGVDDKNVYLWTAMISGYTHLGNPDEAVMLFNELVVTDIRPNEITVATVLSACADLGSLKIGGEVEDYIYWNGLGTDLRVQTSLIHMFSKCGSIGRARQVFDGVQKKDLPIWTSMINGYAIHGMGREALTLFRKMQQDEEGIKPDAIVYTSVLFACSHSGLVEEGLHYFESMNKSFGIEPSVEHYSCLVDLLGRSGCLDLALKTVEKMPVQKQAQGWAPLLSACKKHHNIEMGEFAAKRLLDLNPLTTGNYVLIANFYTSVGKLKEAAMVRRLINDRGLTKEPGWSKIEINGCFHIFVAGDRSHPRWVDIYTKLEEMNVKLVEAGYVAETETVIQELEQEEKVGALKVHSERLAIVFGLISTNEGTTLTIIKNLRTCGDCHAVLKIISRITGRHLIVRDGQRFHHFESGSCSCKDFW